MKRQLVSLKGSFYFILNFMPPPLFMHTCVHLNVHLLPLAEDEETVEDGLVSFKILEGMKALTI